MTRRPLWARRALVLAPLLGAAVLTAPPSHALRPSISPGDRIDYVTAGRTSTFCTLGYVYTGADDHVYGITAGHCRTDDPGYVRDQDAHATGTFVRTSVDPHHTGGPDYGLIDFGSTAMAVPFIGDTPVSSAAATAPRPRDPICHTGVSSGQHCGTIAVPYGDDQYLTTDMPASVPGDSGGPVWYRGGDGAAHVVGIWLGEKTSDGHRYGRFARLVTELSTLT